MWFSRSVAVFCLVLPGFAIAESFQSSIDPTAVAEVKATTQEKYLTSREAYDLLRERPNILFIDVRDPVEIAVSGHPELIDAIVPVRAQSTEFDDELLQWRLKDNPDFLMYMDDLLAKSGKTKHDMIIVTCGSGMRSAQAANKLYEAGYTNVWHIPDGYPGDHLPGFNTANAWRLQGLPWSYSQVHGSAHLRIVE